ncbi:MAG: hypothetical protein J0I06_26500 [Planctomycetes bacterium]|nr:hypothetical protein [Planctomycetota bacterium]
MRTRVLMVCAAGLLIGLLSGCGKDEPSPNSTPGTSPPMQSPTRGAETQKIPPPPKQ